jgi:hypothetical protein
VIKGKGRYLAGSGLTSALSSSLGTLSVVSLSVQREKNTGPSLLLFKLIQGSDNILKSWNNTFEMSN